MLRKLTALQDLADVIETTVSSTLTLNPKTTHILARLHAEKNGGILPTLNVVISHSPDGTNWTDLLTFTEVTTSTNSNEDKQFKISDGLIFPYIRSTATLAGTTPDYTFSVKIYEGE